MSCEDVSGATEAAKQHLSSIPRQPANLHVHVEIENTERQAHKIDLRTLNERYAKISASTASGGRNGGEPASHVKVAFIAGRRAAELHPLD
ncbi:hypothetical protein FXV83_39680 [Bradyrhizobium hipponense]|uniref:Uncharacterized protein n=1 Tax=Bradyrhizobium hipponense TaxID=2605638 RepID=A0A5S4YD34_9BRAD|nr:hypothetical protein FXV83_39680 [Bradyrhizobium hipponense]